MAERTGADSELRTPSFYFFLDFDGTITTEDVVDRMLERFADSRWKAVEDEWVSGKIGSRECLERQVECMAGTPDQLREELQKISVDPGFVPFLSAAQRLGVPVAIISDGFDFFIEEILKQAFKDRPSAVKAVPIYSNSLTYENGRWKATFPHDVMCHHGCANCKPVIMKKLANRSDRVVLVGDGLSDRYAAKKASVTFAKGRLLDVCRENHYPHKRYTHFQDVQKWLEETWEQAARGAAPPRWYEFWKGWTWLSPKKNS